MTRKKLIIGFIILIAAVLIIKEIFAYNPYFMMGIPVGVFGINNMDSTNHSVNVQVIDSKNNLLLNKTYELGHSKSGQWVPEQYINYPENGWESVHDKDRLFPNSIQIDNNGNLSVGEAIV
ncbi:MAG: hypothetical protein WA144_03545 [Candidatus Methanoperedens sp.]